MRILLINGHPDPDGGHLDHALADAYAAGAAEAGHGLTRIDLARLRFSSLRSLSEFETSAPPPDIAMVQEALEAADHLVLIYPLWLGTMPGLLKSLLEQVLRPGFAFRYRDKGLPEKRLKGRSARIVVTMGMPAFFYRWFYGAHGLRNLTRNILHFVGIKPVCWTLIGGVGAMNATAHQRWLTRLRDLGRHAR